MNFNRVLAGICLTTWGLAAGSFAGRAETQTVLVVPERYRVVQFSQDIVRLRPIQLVVHATDLKSGEMTLHVWNGVSQQWRSIRREDYELGDIFGAGNKTVVCIGADGDVPSDLLATPAWAQKMDRIESLNPVDLVNGLNTTLRFKPIEWKWLAKRYGLTLVDQNAERRRYGKYGPPGGSKPNREMLELPEEESPAILPPPKDIPMDAPAVEPAFETPPAPEPVPPSPPEVVTPAPEPDPAPVQRPEDK